MPASGLLTRNQQRLVCLEFAPDKIAAAEVNALAAITGQEPAASSYYKLYEHTFGCQLNYSQTMSLNFRGLSYIPHVVLDTNGKLFFKPTSRGVVSRRKHALHNLSRIPVYFEWFIPNEQKDVFCVHPSKGCLKPNESLALTWDFTPSATRHYATSFNCKVFATSPVRDKSGKLMTVADNELTLTVKGV